MFLKLAYMLALRTSNFQEATIRPGAHHLKQATPILSLCHGIFTDRSIFRLFSREIGHFRSTSACMGEFNMAASGGRVLSIHPGIFDKRTLGMR